MGWTSFIAPVLGALGGFGEAKAGAEAQEYGSEQDAESRKYVADIQKQIAELQIYGNKYSAEIARLSNLETAARQYPGQMKTGQSLSEYLQSKIGTGLSGEEKGLYRSMGSTAIEKGIAGALEEAETTYASQGLRGGSVAERLGQISGSRPELYGSLENKIMEADMGVREQNIAQTLSFLQTSAAPQSSGYPGGESAETVGGGASVVPSGGGYAASNPVWNPPTFNQPVAVAAPAHRQINPVLQNPVASQSPGRQIGEFYYEGAGGR